MIRALQKFVVSMTLLCFAGVVVASGCPAVMDSIWQSGLSAAGSSVSVALTEMVNGYGTTHASNLERVMSALKVLTAQINGSSNISVQANLSAKQASANVAADIFTYKAMSQTMLDFDPVTGQGYNPCVEQDRSKQFAVALGEADTDMQEKVIREIDASPGSFVKDRGAVVNQRLQAAKSLYCTADEAAAGLCSTPGSMAGKDVDASNFFASAPGGSPQSAAKSALLNNMFGLPYTALSKETAQTPAGIAFLDQKRTDDATASVAQAGLKSLQSWTESRSSGSQDAGTSGNQSVLDALRTKVETYSGGGDYDAWAQSQATQSERGLMVELAKMMALDLGMEYSEYQLAEQEEAIVAARLALRAKNLPNGDAAVQASNVRGKVAQ